MNPQYIFHIFIASGASRILFFWRSCLFYFPLMGCFIFSGGTYLAGQTSPTPVAKRGTDSDVTRFKEHDTNQNQHLSQQEFLKSVEKKERPRLLRDFKVSDGNHDQQLTFQEYQNLVASDQRSLPHPTQERVVQRWQKLQTDWGSYDTDGDGKVAPEEFKVSKLAQSVPGLAATTFKDWDRDSNGFVDQQEAEQVLEIAYGLRYTTGEVLWEPSGRMLTTMLFDHLDLNGDHQINLEEAKQAKFGFRDGKQTPALFKEWDQDGNGTLNITEWKAEPSHWRDPVGIFLNSDTDLDGLLNQKELIAGAESWTKEVSAHLIPAFDLDGDQHLSLDEYRQTPFSNLAREWQSLRSDRNQDGVLVLSEFKWKEGLLAKSLAADYFERLDLNHDGKLNWKEFPFRTSKRDPAYYAAEFKKLDTDQNQRLSVAEYLGSKEVAGRRQAKHSFYDWDTNANQQLSLTEFTRRQKPERMIPENEFRFLDENGDQILTQDEFLASSSPSNKTEYKRNFKLFDEDHNERLTFQEFQNIVFPEKRKLTHPIMDWVAKLQQKLQADWSKWDTNGDNKLSKAEFSKSDLSHSIPGLAATAWEDWDRNANGFVDQQETQQVLEIAYGLRYTTGEVLWEPSGRMLTTMLFDHLDLNGDHQIDLDEAKQAQFGFRDGKQTPALFKEWDQDGDGKLSITEWKTESPHWRDPVGIFLNSDTDLDGLLNQKELVAGAESWTKDVSAYLIPAFDLDGDQHLSLDEYRQTPFSNLAREWQSLRTDRNHDGTLALSEFKWKEGLLGKSLAVEFFERLDLNHDGKLDLKEFPFHTNKRDPEYFAAEFKTLDVNRNQRLSVAEYLGSKKGAGRRQAKRSFYDWDTNADDLLSLTEFTERQKPKSIIPQNEFRFLDENNNQLLSREEFLSAVSPKYHPQSARYFKVFDQNGDHQFSYQEYLNLVSPKLRSLSHPVVEHVEALMKKLQTGWNSDDSNGDRKLSPEEFKVSKLAQSVPGLAATAWKDWDRDANGFVDQQETQEVLEIAYGLRYSTGEVLWEPSGRVLTTMLFDHLDLNGDHKIDLEEAKQAQFGFRDGKQTPALFKEWDQDDNGKLNITEWKAEPSHWRDPVGIFLNSDTDLDGLLTREELLAGSESWTKEVSAHLIPAFDLDDDQHLSLDEYRLTPFSNLAREWHSLRSDRNQDGTLSLSEFKWKEGLLAKSLAMEFFERLDLNHDEKLELKEFPFRTTKRDPEYYAAEFKKLDTDQNQRLSVAEYLGSKEGAGRRQAKRSFYNWDSNADDQLSLTEFTKRQKPKSVIPENEFRFLDENNDQSLTQKEYLSSIPAQKRAGQVRYFKLFDADQNDQLTFLEYQNMIAPDKRNLPHPLARRVSEQLDHLKADWSQWDTNGDGKLDRSEFSASGFIRSIPGLALTVWEDWDRNADGVVDQQEIKQVLEIAYGLRYTTGEELCEPSGRMLTAMLFDHLDLNGDHQIDLEEAKQAKFGFHDNKQTPVLFKEWDQDGNGNLSITEWKADPTHWRDPVGIFLNSDTDLDGLLTREELVSGAESWTKEVSAYLIPAFDLDGDLHLSLDEYRQTPFSNLAREWQSIRSDRDKDGKLNRSEFSWKDGLMAKILIVEYFQRLDLNQDTKLDESEFIFRAVPTRANLGTMFTKRDQNQDKTLSFEEYYGNLKLPDNASEKQIVHYESRLARFEDAFRKADINHDKKLDEPEFRSESSLEVIAPHLVQKKKNLSSLTVGKSETSDVAGGDSEVWIVLTLNAFLLLGALIFVLIKTKKNSV